MGSESERDDESGQEKDEVLDDLEEEITKGKWDIEKAKKSQKARGTNKIRTKEEEEKEEEEANRLAEETEKLKTQFFNRHKSTVMSSNSNGSTIFHFLASKAGDKAAQKLDSLVCWMVEIAGEKLVDVDHDQRTAFHIAIQEQNYRILRHMLNAHEQFQTKDGLSRWNLDDILKIQDLNQNTVVHLAIDRLTPCQSKSHDIRVVSKLVQKASKTTLSKRNSSNLTALHLAVDGKRCNPQQVDLVKLLIERCEKALDLRDDTGKSVPSVYERHLATFLEWKKTAVNQHRSGNANIPRQGTTKPGARPDRIIVIEEAAEGAEDEETVGDGLDRDVAPRREPSPNNILFQSQKPTTDNIPNEEVKDFKKPERRNTAKTKPIEPKPRDSSQKPSQEQPKKSTRSSGASSNEILADEDSARQIAEYLKHTFLRARNRRDAFVFLYGAVKGEWQFIYSVVRLNSNRISLGINYWLTRLLQL
jgi:hypothetical protein